MKTKIFLGIVLAAGILCSACGKKNVALDENSSMKTLLRANDESITEYAFKEAQKMGVSSEKISIEYILRDEKNEVVAVKMHMNEE